MTSRKRQLYYELLSEVRRSQAATDRYDEAVAGALGINRTDMRCLDVIESEGPVAAGRLAEATGLTTGAITTVLDRLERRGFAHRVPDPQDRRRVLVELDPQVREGQGEFYGEHMAHAERLYRRYTEAEIELLLAFTREGRELNEREAAKLEAKRRERG